MKNISRRLVTLGGGLVGLTALSHIQSASAQTYPGRPVRMIVPFPPGNMSDLIGRLFVEDVRARNQATAVIENRPGGTGTIGVQTVTKAEPDGYTLLVSSNSPITVYPAVKANLPFDVVRDLAPVALLGWTDFAMVFSPSFPASTLAEAVALFRASPGKYTAANPGAGTAGHLMTELFSRLTGAQLRHVPYQGSGQALNDISQGRVDLMIDALTSSLPQVKGGNVKALALLSQRRSPLAPQVPSMLETGVAEVAQLEMRAWAGMLAPSQVAPQVVEYWNGQAKAFLGDSTIVSRLAAMNVEAAPPGPPDQLGNLVRSELARWTSFANEAGIRAE